MKEATLDFVAIWRLADVPPALVNGPLLKAIANNFDLLASIAETSAWFARRWSNEATERFAAVRTLAELYRLTLDLVRTLPPISRLPPRTVGCAKLIETPQDLRRAGRVARNCLGHYVYELVTNSAAFYIWDDGASPIYIRLTRTGGFGWFLSGDEGRGEPKANRRTLAARRAHLLGRGDGLGGGRRQLDDPTGSSRR
jgi:hypothetical protein